MRPLLSGATLRVIVNPFAAPLDEKGRPCAIVHYDPEHTGKAGTVRRIGCTLEQKTDEERERGKWRGRPPSTKTSAPAQYPRQDTKMLFDLAPIPIVDSVYHRRLLAVGDLLPADQETAKRCSVEFAEPAAILLGNATARIEEWVDAHDGARPDVLAWVSGGHITTWPGMWEMSADARSKAIEAQLKGAMEAGGKRAEAAIKAREDRASKEAEAKPRHIAKEPAARVGGEA